ncbi:MAG: DUF455 family protein [Gammaproteobacteria bacterium]|nr:DUF455 family protein [Gammaproteobacteria bacterium]
MEKQHAPNHYDHVIESLSSIEYLHRACAHIQSGWIVKLSDMGLKLELARHAHSHMQQSARLDRQLIALSRYQQSQRMIPTSLVDTLRRIDDAHDANECLVQLYTVVIPKLGARYERLIESLHPLLDAGAAELLKAHLPTLREEIAWGVRMTTCLPGRRGLTPRVQDCMRAFNAADDGRRIAREQAIWQPLDRVPRAVRPDWMPRAIPGALRTVPMNGWTDPKGIGLAMHNQMHGEFTTMELMSRCAYEHPDMPAAFHLDMTRHAADEARHAGIFAELAARFDVSYGDHPVYTLTYDGYYEFEPACERGSRDELLWRITLRGTIDEGLALDDLAYQADSRSFLEQGEIADACRYILADETFHVQGALKWARHLCGNDEAAVVAAREGAKGFLDLRLNTRRREFEQNHADLVDAELRYRHAVAAAPRPVIPFSRALNVAARRLAGYTDNDLEQLRTWGYVDAR